VDLSGTSHVNYPEIKTLKPTEQKSNTTRKSTVAEIGAHDMGLKQAGTLNITAITYSY
jgi:hypothetical protein